MLVTVYGKIGTKGHKTMKHFATNAEASSAAAKLKSQKLSKGYEAVSEKQTSFDVPKPDKKAEKTAPSATAKIGSNGAREGEKAGHSLSSGLNGWLAELHAAHAQGKSPAELAKIHRLPEDYIAAVLSEPLEVEETNEADEIAEA